MIYNEIEVYFSNFGTRNEVRKRVIDRFIAESPGKGKSDLASRYAYSVEELIDGRKIILKRPAYKKNGFDFLITVENTDFSEIDKKYRDYPKHDEIINDLQLKKQHNKELYEKLYSCIQLTYECKEVNNKWFDNMNFQVGYPCDLLVKTIKWFFIEQDIRFWNYSGRAMLMSSIPASI